MAVLDRGLNKKLVLVAAAAGFGKTTLAAGWCSKQDQPVSWLSLEEGENDPVRFWSYLVAAVQQPYPEFGLELLSALQSPQPPSLDNVLHSFVNQLAELTSPLVICLDDYHVIENTAVHDLMTFLLNHLPDDITIVLLSRSDPPLPLARLRARNELVEVRSANLRFTNQETAEFLNDIMGLGLTTDAIEALAVRTEGWVAGLQLAAIALENSAGDPEAFISAFSGSNRFILDYLLEEVLAQQPPEVRDFLLESSILHQLCVPLCDAVLENQGSSQTLLDYLDTHNLFLIPLDQTRTWYRYHHLFADLLQARLMAQNPERINPLRQRAAQWFESQQMAETAVQYALKAEDYEYAADLIAGPAAIVFHRGEAATLLNWYEALPPDILNGRPQLSVQFGMAFALHGRWTEAERLLDLAEEAGHQQLDPASYTMLAYLVASHKQDIEALKLAASRAAEKTQHSPPTKMVLALIYDLIGEPDAASILFKEAREEATTAGDIAAAFNASLQHSRILVFMGQLHETQQLGDHILEQAKGLDSRSLFQTSLIYSVLGRVYIEWDQLDTAVQYLQEGIDKANSSGFLTGIVSSSTMMLAEAYQAQGKRQQALETAEQALVLAARYDPPAEVEWLKTYLVRIWLTEGMVSAAAEWLQVQTRAERETPLPLSLFYPRQIQPITKARTLLASGNAPAAIEMLTTLTADPPTLFTAEIFAILALARQLNGDSVNAQLSLERALKLGAEENRIRLFLSFGRPMFNLLMAFLEQQPTEQPLRPFVNKLLERFPNDSSERVLLEPLSDREKEILRLIVSGRSNQEIADDLFLALSTVKWYINQLYGKLQVQSRSQAIAKAYELNLLPEN